MLRAIAAILLLGWVFGMVSSFTVNGFIHLLLVLAVAAVLIRAVLGRKI